MFVYLGDQVIAGGVVALILYRVRKRREDHQQQQSWA